MGLGGFRVRFGFGFGFGLGFGFELGLGLVASIDSLTAYLT